MNKAYLLWCQIAHCVGLRSNIKSLLKTIETMSVAVAAAATASQLLSTLLEKSNGRFISYLLFWQIQSHCVCITCRR